MRLLRLLINDTDTPLGASDAARRTGLTPAGARKALDRLQESGIIYRIGVGRNIQYGLKKENPFIKNLKHLFTGELEQYDDLIMSMKRIFNDLDEIQEAWIEKMPTDPSSGIEITLVTETKALSWMGDELRSRLSVIEKRFDLIIETTLFTRADSQLCPTGSLLLKTTTTTTTSTTTGAPSDHTQADQRALLFSQGIAELIRADPSLIIRAKHYLNRMMHDDHGNATQALVEWRNLLETYSTNRTMELLVSDSSRANRLRQSSPFFAILTADERNQILESMEQRSHDTAST